MIVNGIYFDSQGVIQELKEPYPGSNLFSLASGGAIYIRDPAKKISQEQLNGGEFAEVSIEDWQLIESYLKENETYFNIPIARLLEYENRSLRFNEIYRKIQPTLIKALQEEEAWVKGRD